MGAGKDCAALTCVAASYVSWSGLKPIWTFFGHWRKHLQNLKSERRGRELNGECALQRRKITEDPTFCCLCEPRGPVVSTKALSDPGHHPHPYAQADPPRSALETTDFE